MAQIYKEQVNAVRTPVAPDTSGMEYFDKKNKQALGGLDDMLDNTLKQQNIAAAKKEKNAKDLTEYRIKQVWNNNATMSPENEATLNKNAIPQTQEILDTMPDGEYKTYLTAKMQIYASGKQAHVRRAGWELADKQRTEQIKATTGQNIKDIEDNAEYLYDDPDNIFRKDNPDMAVGLTMAKEELMDAANEKNMHGMYVLSESERARLQVKADNLQYTAMKTYMTKTFAYAPKATEKELDFLKFNKEEAMNKYGNDEKSYEQAIADLQQTVDHRKSGEQVYAEGKERDATNELLASAYNQDKGEMKKDFDTPIKMIALMKRIDETPQNSKKSIEAANSIKAGIEKNLVASIHAEPAFDVSDKEAVLTGRPQSALKTATRSVRSAYDNLTGKETRDVYVGTGENGIRNFEIQRVKVPKSGNEALTQSVERKYLLAADQVDTKITRESYLRQPEVMAEYASIISGVTERATAAGIDLDSKIPADIAMVTKFTDEAILEAAQNTYPESSLAIMQEYKDKNVPNAFIANKIRQNAKKNIVITNIASTPKGVTNEVNNKVSEWLSGN